MVCERVAEAAEAKRCGFKLLAVRESVVKDRDRCCLLIALIVRLEGEIICIKLWSGVRGVVRKDSRMGFVVPRVPKSEGVQFHDILYTLSLEILYTSARG